MKIIGFNLTKIKAERKPDFKTGPINTNIEFLSVDKDKIDILKDTEILKTTFKFIITYKEPNEKPNGKEAKIQAEIIIEGALLLSTEKEETKEILKAWKKKDLPPQIRLVLFNLILQRCSVKSLELEEELNIPFHIPMPRIQQKQE